MGDPAFPHRRRHLNVIAAEIRNDWITVHYAAKPYLNAMYHMLTMRGAYGSESASSIVSGFLANATTWRGHTARRVKEELRRMLKEHQQQESL